MSDSNLNKEARMTKFNSLCVKYKEKKERNLAYARTSGQYAATVAKGFSDFIEAPSHSFVLEEGDGRKSSHKYVEVVLVDENWAEASRSVISLNSMYFDGNGFLRFFLALTVEPAVNAHPKRVIQVPCGIKPIGSHSCDFFVGRPEDSVRHKVFDIGDIANISEEINEHLFILLANYLDSLPFEGESKGKVIGFI